ncbi:MAG: pantoate--beta-alanine ligase [Nocardioidaceae bacterium]
MKTLASREELSAATRAPGTRRLVGFVPTMGALHDGHAALLEHVRRHADLVVASIFVNPLQFGPGEDLARYPRSLDADLALCERLGVDVVFTPDVETVYPDGAPQVTVAPGPLGDVLEGASRPGHFAGVLTVVAKLLHLVRPDLAAFGEKDYQQLVLVRRMVADLCMPVEVVGVPTVRDEDGLATSSRNRYLSADQRASALTLGRALRAAGEAAPRGQRAALLAAGEVLVQEPGIALDYLALRSPDLADPPEQGPARLLVAAKVGDTRLIDTMPVRLGLG